MAENVRTTVFAFLRLMSSLDRLKEAERADRSVCLPFALADHFSRTLYAPKLAGFVEAFSEEELKLLAKIYSAIVRAERRFGSLRRVTVQEVWRLEEWREAMTLARQLVERHRAED